jgi:hydroxymethylglutaryl-CoA lyase
MKITECPRDAIQGIKHFIPTEAKARYLNELLRAGFDRIDFGSFVSPKAIPQLADTAEVFKLLDPGATNGKLLAIVANEQGALNACAFPEISYLGFPFSISETFQHRNTGSGITESFEQVKAIQQLCSDHGKELIIYISMAFGNPYGDTWNAEIVMQWVDMLSQLGIKEFSLADTVGIATPAQVICLFSHLIPSYPFLDFGAHLHTRKDAWKEKAEAAFNAGCQRFDTAIAGFGGCPLAGDELIGNMPTDKLLGFLQEKGVTPCVTKSTIENLESSFQQLIQN